MVTFAGVVLATLAWGGFADSPSEPEWNSTAVVSGAGGVETSTMAFASATFGCGGVGCTSV